MEEKYQQINIATQNVNYGTINNYYGFSQPSSSSAEAPHTAQQEKPAPKEYCIYICREKLQEQGIYTLDEFELMTGNASKGTATDFAAFLKRYQAQGILNFMGHSKRLKNQTIWYSFDSHLIIGFRDIGSHFFSWTLHRISELATSPLIKIRCIWINLFLINFQPTSSAVKDILGSGSGHDGDAPIFSVTEDKN